MDEYYRQELMKMAETWTNERLEDYIKELEARVSETRKLIYSLRIIRSRKNRNKNAKDTGTRGGT